MRSEWVVFFYKNQFHKTTSLNVDELLWTELMSYCTVTNCCFIVAFWHFISVIFGWRTHLDTYCSASFRPYLSFLLWFDRCVIFFSLFLLSMAIEIPNSCCFDHMFSIRSLYSLLVMCVFFSRAVFVFFFFFNSLILLLPTFVCLHSFAQNQILNSSICDSIWKCVVSLHIWCLNRSTPLRIGFNCKRSLRFVHSALITFFLLLSNLGFTDMICIGDRGVCVCESVRLLIHSVSLASFWFFSQMALR